MSRRRPKLAARPEPLPKPRVLIVAAEVAPVSGPGGLGEATAGLASALTRDFDVTIAAPLRNGADPERFGLARRLRPLELDGRDVTVYDGALATGRGHLFVIDSGDDNETLCRAALAVADQYDGWPDVVHAQDWRTAPVISMASDAGDDHPRPATVASIHQVDEGADSLRAALSAADCIVAPSPRYARDLQSETAGGALAADFAAASDKLRGILDGIDSGSWDPRRDTALPANYDASDLGGKALCKQALQHELALPRRPRVPLIAAICPLTEAGGGALIARAGKQLGEVAAQFAIVGSGDAQVETAVRSLVNKYPTRFAMRPGGDEALARRVLAAADFLLIPNRFDPNNPNKLACLRYGTVPILSPASGLTDTVIDFDVHTRSGSGIICDDDTDAGLVAGVKRAVRFYAGPAMPDLVERALALDLTWNDAARRYANLYRELIARRAP